MRGKFLLIIAALILGSVSVHAEAGLRTLFLENNAVICGINIRTFNAQDNNGNGIIDENETRGNFINAIDRLDELKSMGINTLHILPITPVGKLKALGTAGSLYAISDFTSINNQLIDKKSKLSPEEQVKLFFNECHKRGINVIVDLPSCGSYDMFLKNPELFIKDEKQLSVVPTDWTDVRLLNTGTNEKLNEDLINIHKKFIDMVTDLGADGIRADVATIKPSSFWEELIKYTRDKNPEFMFLAEASDSWRESPSEHAQFTAYDKLLEVGFDGYYGSFFNLKDWEKASDLYEHIKFNKKLLSSFNEDKSVILSFTTHDELSPILLHGENFSKMICWLEGTLPYNPYIIDGFTTGDDYIYPLTETDDDYYFVHRGKLDIFNFSRRPGGNNETIAKEYKDAVAFRENHLKIITHGSFVPLKTEFENIFAFARCYDNKTIIVIGNLDYKNSYKKTKIKISGINKIREIIPVTEDTNFKIRGNKLSIDLAPGGIKVLLINKFSL